MKLPVPESIDYKTLPPIIMEVKKWVPPIGLLPFKYFAIFHETHGFMGERVGDTGRPKVFWDSQHFFLEIKFRVGLFFFFFWAPRSGT